MVPWNVAPEVFAAIQGEHDLKGSFSWKPTGPMTLGMSYWEGTLIEGKIQISGTDAKLTGLKFNTEGMSAKDQDYCSWMATQLEQGRQWWSPSLLGESVPAEIEVLHLMGDRSIYCRLAQRIVVNSTDEPPQP